MRISSILSFIGFVLLFAGTYCPLLRPFGLINWNVYQLNQPYGLVHAAGSYYRHSGIIFKSAKNYSRGRMGIATGLVVMLLYCRIPENSLYL